MFFWFRDVISEGTYIGNHTLAVQKGLNMGVALFIVSEALFFLAIFWAYFHSALSPTVELGAQWPPIGIEAINAFELFTGFQGVEYSVSSFTLSDGAYGSCFYFGTGFHGLHVIIGTLFLGVGFWRLLAYHLTENHHLGLEAGILYWHFVDVVWLFLFLSVYYWGS